MSMEGGQVAALAARLTTLAVEGGCGDEHREWLCRTLGSAPSVCNGTGASDRDKNYGQNHPLQPGDALVLGAMLSKQCLTRPLHDEAHAALGRAVRSGRIGPLMFHSAAVLATDLRERHACDCRRALPALIAAMLRSASPKAWALAEEAAPLVGRHLAVTEVAKGGGGDVGGSGSGGGGGARRVMPLLEAVVAEAHSVAEYPAGPSAARALSAAACAIPPSILGRG